MTSALQILEKHENRMNFKAGDISASLKALSHEAPNPTLASIFAAPPIISAVKSANNLVKGKEKIADEDENSRNKKRKRGKEPAKESEDKKTKKKSKRGNAEDETTDEVDGGKKRKPKEKKPTNEDGEEEEETSRMTLAEEEEEVKKERETALLHSRRKKEGDLKAKQAAEKRTTEETPEEKQAKLERTIFVGNVPSEIKKKKLQSLFKEFGKVESIRLRSIAFQDQALSKKVSFIRHEFNNKRKSCNAYVVFANKEDAQKALAAHNRVVDDFHIRVDLATGERKLDNARSIFIGNLPFDILSNHQDFE